MKHIFLLITLSLVTLYSQDSLLTTPKERNNALYLELLGNGYGLSVNYDRVIVQKYNWQMGIHLGVGSTFPPYVFTYALTIPYGVTFRIGTTKSKFETGLGGSVAMRYISILDQAGLAPDGTNTSSAPAELYSIYDIIPMLGYRYTSDRGFLFRIYFSPRICIDGWLTDDSKNIVPYGGMSFGWAFGR